MPRGFGPRDFMLGPWDRGTVGAVGSVGAVGAVGPVGAVGLRYCGIVGHLDRGLANLRNRLYVGTVGPWDRGTVGPWNCGTVAPWQRGDLGIG